MDLVPQRYSLERFMALDHGVPLIQEPGRFFVCRFRSHFFIHPFSFLKA
ncbi:hypothetical protein CHCC20339_3607 [Bacillus licheniformis]|nr:hypothetical protein CHCC20339_3607 [Bacillus licheniformis]